MRKKLLTNLLVAAALVALLLLVWLFPSDQDDESPEGVAALDTQAGKGVINDTAENQALPLLVSSVKASPLALRSGLEQFNAANKALESGAFDKAKSGFEKVIQNQPEIVGAYVNLAAIHAKLGDLDAARAVLNSGIKINPGYASLFESWQQLHSAMAAKAYQIALSEETKIDRSTVKVSLPVVKELAQPSARTTPELQEYVSEIETLQQQLGLARAQISQQQEQISQISSGSEANAASGQTGAATLANEQIAALEAQHALEIADLQRLLQGKDSQLLALQAQEQKDSQLAEQEKLAKQQALADQKALEEAQQARQSSQVVDVVKSWARAWSDQDVNAYVAHYESGYVPAGSGLSHAQWVAQRQVRLTNKPFIKVTLSQFSVRAEGDRMLVTFSQHYRSSTLDDKIRKQLTLVSSGDDWSQSKIVAERVVGR